MQDEKLTQFQKNVLSKSFLSKPKKEIYGETVFGGNNYVFMMAKKVRFFGGDKASRLILAFVLINLPGVIFHIYVFPDYAQIKG